MKTLLLDRGRTGIFLLLLCLSFLKTYAQGISETDKYLTFIKYWNFLKYYHPDFTSGKIDADSFFLAKQPLLDQIRTKQELNTSLLLSISELSKLKEVSNNSKIALENVAKINPLHKWYTDSKFLNHELKEKLVEIYNRRELQGHKYVPSIHYENEIPNEKKYEYKDTSNLPVSIRMLALAKLQGVVDYLYPHKSLIDEGWDVIVKNNIVPFKDCNSRKEYEILLLKIVASLKDSHAYNRFYASLKFRAEIFKNTFYPPFDYTIIGDRILVTEIILPDLCAKADIKKGDWITTINKESVRKRINDLAQLLSASNKDALINKLSIYSTNFIWSADSSDYELQRSRSGSKRKTFVDFVKLNDRPNINIINNYFTQLAAKKDSAEVFKIINGKIAYFNIDNSTQFLQHVTDQQLEVRMDSILNLAAKQKGIIFDMRGYPHWGGFVFHYIYKKFSKPENRFANYFKVDLNNLGTFNLMNSSETYYPERVKLEGTNYQGKVIILVNAGTQSLSEWHTMSLQNIFPNSITIGSQSSGADGDERHVNIPGNYVIYFTGNAIYYPNGKSTQGIGVKINKIVHPETNDILQRKDTLLNAAEENILN